MPFGGESASKHKWTDIHYERMTWRVKCEKGRNKKPNLFSLCHLASVATLEILSFLTKVNKHFLQTCLGKHNLLMSLKRQKSDVMTAFIRNWHHRRQLASKSQELCQPNRPAPQTHFNFYRRNFLIHPFFWHLTEPSHHKPFLRPTPNTISC